MGVAALITTATVLGLTAQQKAALVGVSGLAAPRGVGGVIVREWDRSEPRPPRALVFTDQEGGDVRTFPQLPPSRSAREIRTKSEAGLEAPSRV